jgi:hypothetical protein
MYEKMLYGRRVLYFRHAPPFTDLDDVSGRDTRPPYEGAPGYQCSIYYYWWAFLKLSQPYRECCERNGKGELSRLYSFFGDVRDDDFMHWWRFGGHKPRSYSGRRLFANGSREPIIAVGDPKARELEGEHIVMRVPVTDDLTRLTAEFKQLMRPIVEGRIQERGLQKHEAMFEVTSDSPNLKSLHKLLVAQQKLQSLPELKRYDLAKELGIPPKIKGKRGDVEHDIAVYSELARLLRKGRALIRNTEIGRFPDFSKYTENKLPELPRALRAISISNSWLAADPD